MPNAIVLLGGLWLATKLLGGAGADAEVQPAAVDPFQNPVLADPGGFLAEEAEFDFGGVQEFAGFFFEPLEFGPADFSARFPTEENEETAADIAESDRAAAELEAERAAEATAEAARDAAALPRQRQFYIDDLVNRLGVPLAFFSGTIPGNTIDDVLVNYNAIYESYLQQLTIEAGLETERNRLLALQADLVQQLRTAGIDGTPVGSTEDELRASAQGLIDQHEAEVRQLVRLQEAQAAAAREFAAAEQLRLAEASTVTTFDQFSGLAEENVFVAPAPVVTTFEPAIVLTVDQFSGLAEESFFEPEPIAPATYFQGDIFGDEG